MSSSRARSRFAALAAAVPLLIAGGPLVAPAFALNEYTVTNMLADGQVVGPNTGYLGLGTGQTGTTAMFKVSPPSPSATISSVQLTLTQLDNPNSYIFQNELDSTDGLSLYEDTNDNGQFDAADKATGLRSNGFRTGRLEDDGDLPFLITLSAPVSGADYFVALHPATTAVTGRRFTFRIETGGVSGSAGSGPVSPATTPVKTADTDKRLVVDSAAPATPPRSAFTATSRNPGLEDSYDVVPSAVAGETTAKIAFYNSDTTTAPAALLTRPGFTAGTPVTEQLGAVAFTDAVNSGDPTAPNTVFIGDGSGIIAGNPALSVAKNNQVSNAVFARLIDTAGNLSGPVVLSDCMVVAPATTCETARGNPVIGPDAPLTAELSTAGTKITAINLDNQRIVPLQATTTTTALAARTNRATTNATNADTSSRAIGVLAQVVEVDGAGTPSTTHVTAVKGKDYAGVVTVSFNDATHDAFDTIVANSAPLGIREGKASARVVSVDRAGNPSSPKLSLTPYTKDITAPTVSVSSTTAAPSPGDSVLVQFSEPMLKSSITEHTDVNPVTDRCSDDTGARSVESVLDVRDDLSGAAGTDRAWGYGNCFAWSADGTSATITIGDDRPQGCPIAGACIPSPQVGDVVKYAGSGGSSLTDAAGNLAVGEAPAPGHTTIDSTPPLPIPGGSLTKDLDADGDLDAIWVPFTTDLKSNTFAAALPNLSVVGTSTLPVTGISLVDAVSHTYQFAFTSSFGTGEVPALRLSMPSGASNAGLQGGSNQYVAPFSVTPGDGALPQPKSAVTTDDNRDGKIDKVVLTYSEAVIPSKDNNPAQTNLVGPAYNAAGYAPAAPTGGTEGRNTVSPTDNTPNANKSITLTKSGQTFDTAVTPTLKFTAYHEPGSGTTYAPTDGSDNVWTDADDVFFKTPADGAAPFYASRLTRDLDSDGRVDAIDVKFSENIPTVATFASFAVTGHQILDQFGLTQDTIRLVIDETAPASGDTAPAMTPTMQYLGGLTDTSGNAMVADSAPVAVTDGAGPAIMGACPSSPKGNNGSCPEDDPAVNTDDGAKMIVFFSEPLTAGDVANADFVVEQPNGTTKTLTGTPTVTNAADSKSATVLLNFAAGTLDSAQDSFVRLSAAGVIGDAATVKNTSTQTSNVTAYAPPVVTLDLTCPSVANPGYCGTTVVNTGATGTGAVTKWRLKETARGATVDQADYSATRPATITLVEGEHTLYLSGMDSYGRLSPEVSDTINVLTAPSIHNVQFVNKTQTPEGGWSRSNTIVDGDSVLIGADAYGTDAAQWAANSAPTGGGCLAQYMSLNAKGITGVSSQTAIAPSKCDLDTSTQQPHREMAFPVLKASGTTKYPVGTVLKVTDTEPGSLLVDGPGGALARRPFISVGARRSWMIKDASVIKVPATLVNAIPKAATLGYRDGALLRTATGYYYVYNSVKRPVSKDQLATWRMPLTTAYAPTSTELKAMATGTRLTGTAHPLGTWVKYANGTMYQVVKNSVGATVRRQLANAAALKTLVPSSQVYPANSNDTAIPVDTWLRGYRDGTVLVWKDSAGKVVKTGVVARGSLRMFANGQTFNTLGFNASNGIAPNGLAMPRLMGQTYRTATVIDHYRITSIVVTVTNKAGATATAMVLPPSNSTSGGIFGVGALDPIPAGWDTSR